MTPTAAQRAAIESDHPRILASAGAGSGKSSTLALRIQRLLVEGCDPEDIAVVTYTNEAAKVITERFRTNRWSATSGEYFGPEIKLGFCGTLHSFCLRHVDQFGGYDSAVRVIDDEEAEEEMARSISETGTKFTVNELREHRRNWSVYPANAPETRIDIALGHYLRKMRVAGTFDYDLLLNFTEDSLQRGHGRTWTHLLVDEFQDAAAVDAQIYEAAHAVNRYYTGDLFQSIFKFRGADVGQFIRLENDQAWEKHYLTENWRSGQAVLDAANSLARGALEGVQKPLTTLTDAWATVTRAGFESEAEEALAITKAVQCAIKEIGAPAEGFAVLCRTNAIADVIAETMRANGLAVRQNRQKALPADWRLALAALGWLAAPDVESWKRLTRATDPNAENVFREMEKKQTRLDGVFIKTEVPLTGDADKLEAELRMLGVGDESATIIKAKFYELPETASLRDLCAELAFERITEEDAEGVFCSTIHQAKGKEFDRVILAGFEEEVIPGTGKRVDLEEERRIAYVGITRARRDLAVTWARWRREGWGRREQREHRPSRFIEEAGL